MAKSRSFLEAPWPMKPQEMNDYILVTEENKANAFTVGRILYHINTGVTKNPIYLGYSVIDPCFVVGKYRIELPPFWNQTKEMIHSVFVDQEKSEWSDFWKKKFDIGIKKKTLYINPKDPILKYFKL